MFSKTGNILLVEDSTVLHHLILFFAPQVSIVRLLNHTPLFLVSGEITARGDRLL